MKTIAYLFLGMPALALAQFSGSTTTAGTIYREGNVGIGVTAPAAKLELYENAALDTKMGSNKKLFSIGGSVNNSFRNSIWITRETFFGMNIPTWMNVWLHDGISIDDSFTRPGTDTKTWWARKPADDVQAWGNAAITYMTLKAGALGLGTKTPEGKLEVYNMETRPSFVARALSLQGGYCIMANVNHSSTKSLVVSNNNYGDAGANWKEPFVVYGTGRTQIGLKGISLWGPHYDAMLSVDGKVVAKSMYITIEEGVWADYVFDKTYKLMPLVEVEQYYRKHKHLPGIQSAAEVMDSGINVAEMNAKLLEKIEELTMYTVELKKEMEQLQQELKKKK